ncbi:hypothetical protein ACXZ1K_12805 [Pedobacter sp. PWIIR3]
MEDLDSLRKIWHTANTDVLPSSKEMISFVKNFRNQKLRKKWTVIISSSLLVILILLVLFLIDFQLITTYIGGGIMAISIALLAATNIQSLKRFYQLKDYSNIDFLAFIEQTRINQIRYYKRTQVIIMFLSSVGLVLYLYELSLKHKLWFLGGCVLWFTYLILMWFLVRKRNFQKDAEELLATREQLEKILKQLK